MVPAKAHQRALFTQFKALPWAQIPAGDRRRDHGHGHREARTAKAVTVHTPGGIASPHAQQADRIARTRANADIARATRRPHDLGHAVTSSNPRTQ
ncbi:transposase [Micromonospora sp. NPDC092111]|uniref:transposase n=1 Tax=Micromonospora sp. NPDC092111 TaxID=3364289 RepID=UPI0038068091